MFQKNFWLQALERAIKSAAQVVILILGGAQFDVMQANFVNIILGVAAGFCLSIAMSIVSAPFGQQNDPSLIKKV